MQSTSLTQTGVVGVGYASADRRSCGIVIGRDTRCTPCRIVREADTTAVYVTSPLHGPMLCPVIEGKNTVIRGQGEREGEGPQ